MLFERFTRFIQKKLLNGSLPNNNDSSINDESAAIDNTYSYEPVLMKKYNVRGVNKNTNRRKTLKIDAKNPEMAEQLAFDSELLPPYETTEIFERPSEAQIGYALSLNIGIPENATKLDVSYLISRVTDEDSEPNPGLLEYADNRNMIYSKYIGKKILYNTIFEKLTGADKIAFFSFCIYRWLSDDRHPNLDTHPDRDVFYEFAKRVVDDKKFLTSMNRYLGEDLRFFGNLNLYENGWITNVTGGSANTYAYKKASQFLSEVFGTPLTRTKTWKK